MSFEEVTDQTVVLASAGAPLPPWLPEWWARGGLATLSLAGPDDVMALALRARPRAIVVDARPLADGLRLCRRLKRDAWTAIVPVVVLCDGAHFAEAFAAGADEVLRTDTDDTEAAARLDTLLRRSDRDMDVHPSTRLPGTREIEAELARRLLAGDSFAACYADLDHFKEFNDRYGFHHGDQVIRLLARLLHDVVKGLCGEQGFVGHIGGDDFLYVVPLAAMARVCDEVIRVFDELVPLQYSDTDRGAGYFLGKDRRGILHRVPLMTLSVGVVTNQRRRFARAVDVSELATEMKSFAKTLPGSVWTVDRRRDDDQESGGQNGALPPEVHRRMPSPPGATPITSPMRTGSEG